MLARFAVTQNQPMDIAMPKVSKSKLSMFLRTRCDRALYLSLHTDAELKVLGMPEPLSARPGIGQLKKAGIDFETIKNNELRAAFGANVLENGVGGIATTDLATILAQVGQVPAVILQGRFQPQVFRAQALGNIGLNGALQALIPPLDGMIPDIIVVRSAKHDDKEICPDGTRQPVAAGDQRLALNIIDVKHASEPNASYSAEVALYAYMVSNLIAHAGLSGRFFVSDDVYLWTRSTVANSQLSRILAQNPQAPLLDKLSALFADCDKVPFSLFIQTVRRFFAEDLPRVLNGGNQGWAQLDWHVDTRCSACDWLGYGRWLGPADRQKLQSHPDHYCVPNAALIDHLSRIVGITRGARRTLANNAIATSANVAGTTGAEPAYRQHSVLKKERHRIPSRALALAQQQVSVDQQAIIASLARNVHLQINIAVNFDSGAGLLTGLAAQARLSFPYRQPQIQAQALGNVPFLVQGKSFDEEWIALEAFLNNLENVITRAEQLFIQHGFTKAGGGAQTIHTQVAFWERRQYEELCAAVGRHLPRVFALANRKTRALAWLFPADELIERDEGAVSPCIVFVEDIARRVLNLPVAHTLTLFDAVEHYHWGQTAPYVPDAYYREYLTNGIPRERIYEIWSGLDPVQRGLNQSLPRANLIQNFMNTLQSQVRCLDNITLKLRSDLRQQLRGRAAALNLSIPRGPNNVSFDGKLWIWWDELDFATTGQEALSRLAETGQVLEASYTAIRLIRVTAPLGPDMAEYEVSPESAEAKIDDGEGFLAVGLDAEPGFPLSSLANKVGGGAPFPPDPTLMNRPLFSVLNATLIRFDRHALRAVIRFDVSDPQLLPYIRTQAGIDLDNNVFVTPTKPFYNMAKVTTAVLREIGSPPIAQPDPAAAGAMGQAPAQPGADPISPPARVLWDAANLQTQQFRTAAQATGIAQAAHALHQLNPSQIAAINHAAQYALTVIWGPPGTGKTKTLVGLLHALTRESNGSGQPINILVSGPTYKAVEEIIGRFLEAVAVVDPLNSVNVNVGYSRARMPLQLPNLPPHVNAKSFNIDNGLPEWMDCLQQLGAPAGVNIFATTVHQAHKAPKGLCNRHVAPIFDVVILDECSQIPVSRSLAALGALKDNGQLVVAGDHLQMPPIFALEPPVGAEHLVGSIHTYLLRRDFGQPVAHVTCSTLLENYRSAAHLVAFARTIGYPANLVAANGQTALHLLAPVASLQAGFPNHLPWSDAWQRALDPQTSAVTILHDDDLSSQSNEFEARMVAALVYCLRSVASSQLDGRGPVVHGAPQPAEFWSKSVGIVTPHRAQRAAIIAELRQTFPADPLDAIVGAVDTVEKFQGGERHTVIVSFGVGDPDVMAGEEAFLMQLERTNVAISRAMAKCIVVMPTTLAAHVPEDKRALETAHALKGYVEEFCNNRAAIVIDPAGIARPGTIRWHA